MILSELLKHAIEVSARYAEPLAALESRLTQTQVQLEDLTEYELLRHQMAMARLEPLRVAQPIHLAWFTFDPLEPILRLRIRHAIETVRLFVKLPENQLDCYLQMIHRPEMVCEYRHVRVDYSEVYLRTNAPTSVIVHELGHWLEESVQSIKQVALEHIVGRVRHEAVIPLGTGYHRTEFTQKDAFLDPYLGKCQADGSRVYTELLSVGLEWLYRDPVRLCRFDPQTATFLIDLLESL